MGYRVDINVSYRTTEAGGVRIFTIPFGAGSESPDYRSNPSPLYAPRAGVGSGYFWINSGTVKVDRIRIQMMSGDLSRVLFEAFLPVSYSITQVDNDVNRIVLRQANPGILDFDRRVTFDFNYVTVRRGGVRIFVTPLARGVEVPGAVLSASPLYPVGPGTGSGFFTVRSGPVVIDSIRFEMWTDAKGEMLFQGYLPVHYRFGAPSSSHAFTREGEFRTVADKEALAEKFHPFPKASMSCGQRRQPRRSTLAT